MLKTHTCGELRAQDVGTPVRLAGWVHRRRDHGNIIFVDLRDRWGLTQVVFNPDICCSAHDLAGKLRSEFVIQVVGTVHHRPEGLTNPKLATGEIEVIAQELVILNEAKPPVFAINEDIEPDEALRLRYPRDEGDLWGYLSRPTIIKDIHSGREPRSHHRLRGFRIKLIRPPNGSQRVETPTRR